VIRDCGFVRLPNAPSSWSRRSVQTPSRLRHAPVNGAATATDVRSQASVTLAAAKTMPVRMIAAVTSTFSFTRRRCHPSWRAVSEACSQRSSAATTKRTRWPIRFVNTAEMFAIIAAPRRRIASRTRW
jgi:hypothetical protein